MQIYTKGGTEHLTLPSLVIATSNAEASTIHSGPAQPSLEKDQSSNLQRRIDMSVDDLDEEISHRSSTMFLSVMDVFKVISPFLLKLVSRKDNIENS
jgi:hypothetical protein